MTTDNITIGKISALCREAQQAGDIEMAEICLAALEGDEGSIAVCEKVIADAEAMCDE